VPKKSVQLSGVVVAESAICSIDPDEGVLMYRGYDIAELAERSTYEETALLLLDGDLPSSEALEAFERELADLRELPAETEEAIDRQAGQAAPMDVLRTAVSTLRETTPAQLISQLPTIVARYHRRREGLEPVAPDASLSYSENFLSMLHGSRPSERDARAFDVAMILHAEHELNASTFAARVVTGTGADLTAAVVAAIAALSGPLHGGANEAAMALFERIGSADRLRVRTSGGALAPSAFRRLRPAPGSGGAGAPGGAGEPTGTHQGHRARMFRGKGLYRKTTCAHRYPRARPHAARASRVAVVGPLAPAGRQQSSGRSEYVGGAPRVPWDADLRVTRAVAAVAIFRAASCPTTEQGRCSPPRADGSCPACRGRRP
jgi:hypothetical protein